MGIPAEFWKAILRPGSAAIRWALEICNLCWNQQQIPDQWHAARVAMIFKKGDLAQCENYRPICLLQIGYKIFAIILLNRLRDAGAEDNIWRTQFGFKRKCGTIDAVFLARRVMEEIWGRNRGKGIFVALDWAKAFDSISPESMTLAFVRFGLPSKLISVLTAIYTNRHFTVRDHGCVSSSRTQQFGICQGCPLSPFLFTIVMIVLLYDARYAASLIDPHVNELFVEDLVYADDTLLLDVHKNHLQIIMDCVMSTGKEYGLTLNWSKVEVLPVRTHACLFDTDGDTIQTKSSIIYLGSLLAADGRIASELGRRLGMAKKEFQVVQMIWSHSTLTRSAKI